MNPTSVQGWNGVAIFRTDVTQDSAQMVVLPKSMQMESDLPEGKPDLI